MTISDPQRPEAVSLPAIDSRGQAPEEHVWTGVLLKLASSVGFLLMVMCAKFATETMPSSLVVFVRGAVMVAVLLPILIARGTPLIGRHLALLHLRCALGTGALLLYFHALRHAQLGQVVVLANTSPLFVPALGALFLGERWRPEVVGIQVLGFVGVIAVAGPELGEPGAGALAALGTGIFVAFGLICLKRLSGKEHALTIVFTFSLWTLLSPLAFAGTWDVDGESVGAAWPQLLGTGIFAIGGQLLPDAVARLRSGDRRRPAQLLRGPAELHRWTRAVERDAQSSNDRRRGAHRDRVHRHDGPRQSDERWSEIVASGSSRETEGIGTVGNPPCAPGRAGAS